MKLRSIDKYSAWLRGLKAGDKVLAIASYDKWTETSIEFVVGKSISNLFITNSNSSFDVISIKNGIGLSCLDKRVIVEIQNLEDKLINLDKVNSDKINRPRTRADCKNVPRPCPFVSCRYHLYLDVRPKTGSIKMNFKGVSIGKMKNSRALDLTENYGMTLDEVGAVLNITSERTRQIENEALFKLRRIINKKDL
jgi:hypothetical protein